MLRHTRPDIAPGICYGQTDLDLADSFEREADQVLRSLPAFSAIVSSPLRRCRKLADLIADRYQQSIRIEPRLAEMDFGRWEGVAWNDIPRGELDQWAEDFSQARPHGGESVSALKARVEDALADIRMRQAPTLIVTHAGVIRAALAQGPEAHHFQTQVEFGEVIRLPDSEEEHP